MTKTSPKQNCLRVEQSKLWLGAWLFTSIFCFSPEIFRWYQLVILCLTNDLLMWKMWCGTFSHLRPNVFPDSGALIHSRAAPCTEIVHESACCRPNRPKGLVEITKISDLPSHTPNHHAPSQSLLCSTRRQFCLGEVFVIKKLKFSKKVSNSKKVVSEISSNLQS